MIHFEEFKTKYTENVDVFVEFPKNSTPKPSKVILRWDFKENEDGIIKLVEDETDTMAACFPVKFSLLEIDRPFFLSVETEENETICTNLMCELQDFFQGDDNIEVTKTIYNDTITMKISLRLAENTYPYYSLSLGGKNLPLLSGIFGGCDPFFKVYKKLDTGKYSLIYESEVYKNQKNPNFKDFVVTGDRFCGNQIYKDIKIQMWDFSKRGEHYIVGEANTTLHQLIHVSKQKNPIIDLVGPNKMDKGRNFGKLVVYNLLKTQGPSIIRKIFQGWQMQFICGIDCTGITVESQDLDSRANFIIETVQKTMKKIGYFILNDHLQFFGLNGKCCTDNLYTNYTMDVFPISGDIEKNGYKTKQLGGLYFKRIMNNFLNNTEGGEIMQNLSSFIKYAVDYCDECLNLNDKKVFSIIPIFLWEIPEDIQKCIEEFVALGTRSTVFWIIYFGKKDREVIKSLDCKKGYLFDDHRKIGVRRKVLAECVSLNSDIDYLVSRLIQNTQHLFAFHKNSKSGY